MESVVGLSNILRRELLATWLISASFQAYILKKRIEHV